MNSLKNLLIAAFFALVLSIPGFAQDSKDESAELKGKVEGIDENVTTLLTDVAGLKKLKISGYFQGQFEKTEVAKGFGLTPYDSTQFPQDRFRIRRARVKFTYDAGITQFVFQGDFGNSGFALKDFYLNITDPWMKTFDLTLGQFNRPTYEVEYSSSVREAPERSKTTLTLYPNERDLGMMLTIHPEDWFKLQLAAFNNTYLSSVAQTGPTFRDEPFYYMARLTKGFKITDGLDVDLGVHARIGSVTSNAKYLIPSDQPTNTKALDSTAGNYGSSLSRSWFGAEMQLYWDFLGGVKLLGEYMTGKNVDELPSNTTALASRKIRQRDFAGFYAMLVKNIGTEWAVAARLDQYNPNTKIENSVVNTTSDLALTTIGFGIHNYTFDNIRITLWYDMPKTTTTDGVTNKTLAADPKDNLLTLRFQYKF